MKHSHRMVAVALAGMLAAGLTASGCATPWFGTRANKNDNAPAANSPVDLKQATVTYISSLCKLAKEQRDPTVRELNEALLPNHATIWCGRGGEP